MNELTSNLENLAAETKELVAHLELEQRKQTLLEMEDEINSPDFWSDPKHAGSVSKKAADLREMIGFWETLPGKIDELLQLLVHGEISKEDEDTLQSEYRALVKEFSFWKVLAQLSGKYDTYNALISFHAGAGGIDAMDWAEMLMRMITRYCEKKGFSVEVLDLSKNPEAGIKSATLEVRGSYAYGFLKSEAGVHRLVRLSPYNPAHTRETSFALIEVLPALEEVKDVVIKPDDLKIEANTASGHGGQSVNTTYSAIRITHIPTGIKVSIQNERSQSQNKETAMRILASRLQALEEEKMRDTKKELRGEFKSAEWGNQIRNYVLHPYKLVKDTRTGVETTNAEDVLEGNLDEFIETYLKQNMA